MGAKVGGEGEEDAPMGDMNTTPLIDVMLVLLIMFILGIPVQTHAVKLDMPNPNAPPPPETLVEPVINKVEIDFLGTIFWNGNQIDVPTLNSFMNDVGFNDDGTKRDVVDQAEVHIRPDALAEYRIVNKVMASAQRNNVVKVGFIGNEAYAQ